MDPLNGQIDPLSLCLENPLILLIIYWRSDGPLDGLMVSLNGQNARLDRQIYHQNDWIAELHQKIMVRFDFPLGCQIYPVWQNGSLLWPDGSAGWPDRPFGALGSSMYPPEGHKTLLIELHWMARRPHWATLWVTTCILTFWVAWLTQWVLIYPLSHKIYWVKLLIS